MAGPTREQAYLSFDIKKTQALALFLGSSERSAQKSFGPTKGTPKSANRQFPARELKVHYHLFHCYSGT